MKTISKLKIVALLLTFFGVIGFSKNAFADDIIKTGIQISPTVQRLSLDPGAHYEGHLTITNIGAYTFNFNMQVTPYQVNEDTYDAIFNIDNGYTQISHWITFDEERGTVEPGEVKNITYHIEVPEDAPGGGQFAALFAETEKDLSDTGTVQANAGVGTVLLAQIGGETREDGGIISTDIPGFLLNPPLAATVKASNKGNIDEEIKNTLEIRNYFSGEVIYEDTTPQTNTLLPGTERSITLIANNIPRLGLMKVSLTTEYINDAQIKTATVVVCPLWFIAIVLLIILTIVVRVIARRRDDRRTRANSRNSQGSADKFNI